MFRLGLRSKQKFEKVIHRLYRHVDNRFDCSPAISTREIRCGESSAILASAIEIDVERFKNSPRLVDQQIDVDKIAYAPRRRRSAISSAPKPQVSSATVAGSGTTVPITPSEKS